MPVFGLIGYPLTHSFSPGYFKKVFDREGRADCVYALFPLEKIELLPSLLAREPEIRGLNVTIPYKQSVIPFLTRLDETAAEAGAVNTIVRTKDGMLVGYNTDIWGFEQSLKGRLDAAGFQPEQAFVLGTGGASRAVTWVLRRMGIPYHRVSRHPTNDAVPYEALELLVHRQTGPRLWVNTTPLGMWPDTESCPNLPFYHFSTEDFVFDLVYNPPDTLLLQRARAKGAAVQNGLEMLYGQAERAWMLWADL